MMCYMCYLHREEVYHTDNGDVRISHSCGVTGRMVEKRDDCSLTPGEVQVAIKNLGWALESIAEQRAKKAEGKLVDVLLQLDDLRARVLALATGSPEEDN